MYPVQEAVARKETRQDSALEKLNACLYLEVAQRFGPRAPGASEKVEDAPSQTDNARVHRETETQEAARLETGAAPTRVKVDSAPEAPAHKRPDARSERKAATEGETRRGAQPDAAKRAKPASAISAERKGRDASSQNNKSKKTPKHRGSSDMSDSDSSSGSSNQDSDHSDSSSFEDFVPNVPTVTGLGGTMFTFRPYVNASALEDFDETASLEVAREVPEYRSPRRLDGQGHDL
ncbi:unnamed protein product [Phytophthora fragariaefolia]|uniref:Unnamed protein product n=1 Tax=Phytophthora fragariaefolia TaxID=1490495 RepID=A0A9W6WSG8_9STRA|nr:unnamed protein product [Phytophthora fragariaefolia]